MSKEDVKENVKDDVKDDVNAQDKGDEVVKKDVDTKDDVKKDADIKPEKKEPLIPKSRFDEAVKKERARAEAESKRASAAETELKKLRNEAEDEIQRLAGEIDKLDEQYEEAVADGKTKEAAAIRKALRAKQDRMIDVKTERKLLTATAQTKSEIEYNSVLSDVEETFPQLDPDSDDFDEDLAEDMAAYVEGKVRKGASAAQALRQAVARFIGEDKTVEAEEARDKRALAARQKVAEAAKKQPASLRDVGDDHDKKGTGKDGKAKSLIQMSQEEFAKVSEEELAKARGDVL